MVEPVTSILLGYWVDGLVDQARSLVVWVVDHLMFGMVTLVTAVQLSYF